MRVRRAVLVGLVVAALASAPVAVARGDSTEGASIASQANEGDGISLEPAISADGRYVAFESAATNLVPGDTNGAGDIFVHDRVTGTTERVSVAGDGSQGNGTSRYPAISPDGRYVAFESYASNLVSGDTNSARDIFVYDRQNDSIERVSVASDWSQGNGDSLGPIAVSEGGRYVVFHSDASNLVSSDLNSKRDVFVRDRSTANTERIGGGLESWGITSISNDGRYVAFVSLAYTLVPGDTNWCLDVFVRDRQTGTTERVSVASDGSEGDGVSLGPAISADGRYVAFESAATNLVPGDTNNARDIFVHDRVTGTTERVSVAGDGSQGNDESTSAAISADGRYVAFESAATNLVPGDTNNARDIFVYDRQAGTVARVSVGSDGGEGEGNDGSGQSVYVYIPVAMR